MPWTLLSNSTAAQSARAQARSQHAPLMRRECLSQHVSTAASTSEQPQQQQRRDMNSVLGARGYASFNKQIGDGRPVTGRVWDGIAGRAPPVDPPDPTQIDHDTSEPTSPSLAKL